MRAVFCTFVHSFIHSLDDWATLTNFVRHKAEIRREVSKDEFGSATDKLGKKLSRGGSGQCPSLFDLFVSSELDCPVSCRNFFFI